MSIELKSQKKPADQGAANEMALILRQNNLVYRLPDDLSSVTQRRFMRQIADRSTYGERDTIVVNFNSSSDYVYGPNSYLILKVQTAGVASTFGSGSALNLFESAVLTSHSGVELDRNTGIAARGHAECPWSHERTWMDDYAPTMGYPVVEESEILDPAASGITVDGAIIPAAAPSFKIKRKRVARDLQTVRQFIIPLSKLSGAFAMDKLMPGTGFMAGCRLDLNLSTNARAFVSAGAPTMAITDVEVVLDTYSLADNVLRQLNMISAGAPGGLQLAWTAIDHQIATTSSTVFNGVSTRAVSRALGAFAKFQRQLDDAQDMDSVKSESTIPLESFQWQLGTRTFPNRTLSVAAGTTEHPEFYNYSHWAMKSLFDMDNMSAVSQLEYDQEGLGIVGVSLERSTVLDASGLPVSGSRQLQLRSTLKNAVARNVHTYMYYSKVAQIQGSNVIVKE